ncbi:MAG: molybdenum-binding protein [Spirochaetales bacterium]|nr:MAG: molybdenum-binding protein [Spirochaetales bacterium]
MKHGARNTVKAKVKSIKKGDIMSLIKLDITVPAEMSSVLTTESLEEMDLKVGDELKLAIKAVHVLPYMD